MSDLINQEIKLDLYSIPPKRTSASKFELNPVQLLEDQYYEPKKQESKTPESNPTYPSINVQIPGLDKMIEYIESTIKKPAKIPTGKTSCYVIEFKCSCGATRIDVKNVLPSQVLASHNHNIRRNIKSNKFYQHIIDCNHAIVSHNVLKEFPKKQSISMNHNIQDEYIKLTGATLN